MEESPVISESIYPDLSEDQFYMSSLLARDVIEVDAVITPTRRTLLNEFNEFFQTFDYATVRQRVLDLQLVNSHFTTVIWRIFLDCLTVNMKDWSDRIDTLRKTYEILTNQYILDLTPDGHFDRNDEPRPHEIHPLCSDERNPWSRLVRYKELKSNINQDVTRTFPELSYFQRKENLDVLLKILLVHCQHYQEKLPYRQGMHEIAAVILHTINSEIEAVRDCVDASDLMKKIYDPNYIEHDTFSIYEKIMEHLGQFYDFQTGKLERKSRVAQNTLFLKLNDQLTENSNTAKLISDIFDELKFYEPKLHEKLQKLDIEPTIYGIRWLRLLFAREILFEEIPTLWTVIFCYDKELKFMNFIFQALLIRAGEEYRKGNMEGSGYYLQILMRHQTVPCVEELIKEAFKIQKLSLQLEFNRANDENRLWTHETDRGSDNRRKLQPLSSKSSITTENSNKMAVSGQTKPISLSQFAPRNPLAQVRPKNSNMNYLGIRNSSDRLVKETEMQESPGKETVKQYSQLIEQQNWASSSMRQLIENLRQQLSFLSPYNDTMETVTLKLNGLEQISHVLEGTMPLDLQSIQSLIDYEKGSIEKQQ